MRKWGFLLASVLFVAPLASCRDRSAQTGQTTATTTAQSQSQQGSSRIDTIVSRGKLICGISGELPGFSFVDEKGKYSGLDVDVCRAVAAAIFDDPEKVEYRKLNAKDRFTVLQAGESDLLSRTAAYTARRDATTGGDGAPVICFDCPRCVGGIVRGMCALPEW
ncbi:MAG: transporter substrate-binding domain-containing protein, partial [Cyanobacteria bacterium 0813]|nr:transporter substrate-binding domain-containing protein [Cyanobacteria bacterium 0813]